MKKIVFLGTALAALVSLNSCKDKTTTTPAPTVVQELYPSPTIKIGYTIHVISNGATSKTAGLTGATVTVKQNGQTYTGTTDESGMVTFANLTEGYITYFVKASNFASFNGSDFLSYEGSPDVNGTNGNSSTSSSVNVTNEQTTSYVTSVTLPRLGASVTGTLMADMDGSGSQSTAVLTTGTIQLKLDNVKFEPNVFTTTVSNGVYTFSNLPEDLDYTLSTLDIFETIPASVNTPSFKNNLEFPGNADNGTTPSKGKTEQRGLVTLQ
ncbi:MAG: hypothetical protein U0V72_03800 [Cytophagales bacterium]